MLLEQVGHSWSVLLPSGLADLQLVSRMLALHRASSLPVGSVSA